ncbi:hypothetical protein J6590_104593 [Homalodisca vitripennis]|nr:hypothetical protein J6590_104593 [Homalodisca vitripennis]
MALVGYAVTAIDHSGVSKATRDQYADEEETDDAHGTVVNLWKGCLTRYTLETVTRTQFSSVSKYGVDREVGGRCLDIIQQEGSLTCSNTLIALVKYTGLVDMSFDSVLNKTKTVHQEMTVVKYLLNPSATSFSFPTSHGGEASPDGTCFLGAPPAAVGVN